MYNVETYMDLYWTSTCRPMRLTSKQMALRRLETTRLVVGLQEYEGIFLYPLTVLFLMAQQFKMSQHVEWKEREDSVQHDEEDIS